MKTFVCVATILLVWISPVYGQEEAENGNSESASIVDALRNHSILTQTDAERLLVSYEATAIQDLLIVVEHEGNDVLLKSHAFFCLGVVGAEEVVGPATHYIENNLKAGITQIERSCIRSALLALGFVGSNESMNYLRDMVLDAYWMQGKGANIFADQSPADRISLIQDWQQVALMAIALQGTEQSVQTLEELQDTCSDELILRVLPSFLEHANARLRGDHLLEAHHHAVR